MTTRIRTSIVAAVALLAIVAAPSAGAQVERSEEQVSGRRWQVQCRSNE